MSQKSNYEILGLPENAPRDVVERKYGALLRQYKQRTDEKDTTNEDLEYYREITAAYDAIVGTVHDFTDTNPTSIIPYKVRRWFGRRMAELDSFKMPIIAILLLTIIGVMVYLQVKDANTEDISIKFIGAFNSVDVETFGNEIAQKADSINNPLVTFFTVTTDTERYNVTAMNQAEQFRAQILARRLDFILIDTESYDVYIDEYVFLRLDDFIEEYRSVEGFSDALARYNLVTYTNEGEDDPLLSGVYGIEISKSSFFDDMNLNWLYNEEDGQSKSMILCICRTSENQETAKKLAADIIMH